MNRRGLLARLGAVLALPIMAKVAKPQTEILATMPSGAETITVRLSEPGERWGLGRIDYPPIRVYPTRAEADAVWLRELRIKQLKAREFFKGTIWPS